ncbi:MAG: tryptophan--tRNA ligase, partial [Deltaproteobacteria bacterium]|nr:tryptophan--tRNA ligase [Deltaproteobacteria bacterium]
AAYSAIKKELVGILWDHFRDARDKRAQLIADPGYIREVLARGANKARAIAQVTIDKVRRDVGLVY